MISQQKIDSFLSKRAKGHSRAAILNFGGFTVKEFEELAKMFPKKEMDSELSWRSKGYFDKIR